MENEIDNLAGLFDNDEDILNSLKDMLADLEQGKPMQWETPTASSTYVSTSSPSSDPLSSLSSNSPIAGTATSSEALFDFDSLTELFLSEQKPTQAQEEVSFTTLTTTLPAPVALESFAVTQPEQPLFSSSETFGWQMTDDKPAAPEEKPQVEEKPKSKGSKVARVVFNCIFYLLCVVIVVGAVTFTLSQDPRKSYFGYRIYTVKTPSMTPQKTGPSGGFRAGDLILVKLVEPETIKEQDIITFVPNKGNANAFLTHRVVTIKTKLTNDSLEEPALYFITRGDANDTDDPPISADMVIGKKVFSIPKVGLVLQYIRANLVLSVVFVVSTFGFFFTLRYYFAGSKKEKKVS